MHQLKQPLLLVCAPLIVLSFVSIGISAFWDTKLANNIYGISTIVLAASMLGLSAAVLIPEDEEGDNIARMEVTKEFLQDSQKIFEQSNKR